MPRIIEVSYEAIAEAFIPKVKRESGKREAAHAAWDMYIDHAMQHNNVGAVGIDAGDKAQLIRLSLKGAAKRRNVGIEFARVKDSVLPFRLTAPETAPETAPKKRNRKAK